MIEAVALGWKIRRIFKIKEVLNRIQQIRDYENAEEDTLNEVTKTSANEER